MVSGATACMLWGLERHCEGMCGPETWLTAAHGVLLSDPLFFQAPPRVGSPQGREHVIIVVLQVRVPRQRHALLQAPTSQSSRRISFEKSGRRKPMLVFELIFAGRGQQAGCGVTKPTRPHPALFCPSCPPGPHLSKRGSAAQLSRKMPPNTANTAALTAGRRSSGAWMRRM